MLINEGDSGTDRDGERIFSVEVTQKVPVWLKLTAVDTPGHGSMPNATSSVTRIVDALNILRTTPFPARIIPAVDAMFSSMSQNMSGDWADAYADMASAIEQPGFLENFRPSHLFNMH